MGAIVARIAARINLLKIAITRVFLYAARRVVSNANSVLGARVGKLFESLRKLIKTKWFVTSALLETQ